MSAIEISERELTLLNFYRASELHGGLVLAQLARRVRDGVFAVELLRHGEEEIGHARLWTETILAVGGRVLPVRETYQDRYAAALGLPMTMLDVLALTQVFERRVFRHFMAHRRRPGTHPVVCATLERMLEEERGHLSWVKRWLDRQAADRPELVRETMRRFAAADARIYEALTLELGWREAA